MYVPPHLKQIQKTFKTSAAPKNVFSSFTSKEQQNVGMYKEQNHFDQSNHYRKQREEYVDNYSEKEELPKEKQTKSLTEYLESKSKQEVVKDINLNDSFKVVTLKPSVKKEAVEDTYAKINDFWNDLYQFTTDSNEKVHLQWNHHISKESMVKLLKEQGTIKFNVVCV